MPMVEAMGIEPLTLSLPEQRFPTPTTYFYAEFIFYPEGFVENSTNLFLFNTHVDQACHQKPQQKG